MLERMTSPPHRRAFGEHLRALRQERGDTSQEAFAHLVDLDRTYISGLERGVWNPTLDVIVKLTRALGLTPAQLLVTIDA